MANIYRPEKQIWTIGDLIEWLKTFDPNWTIHVNDSHGIPRYNTHIDSGQISTVLTSDGEEVVW